MNRFNGWTASLSNGDNVFEQPTVQGEKSSWQKLLDRLDAESLRITQLQLQRFGITITCDHHKKVDGYCMAYEATMVMFRETETRMQGVGSIVGDLVFMTWLDANGNVRHNIRPLSEMRVHSTLRNQHVTKDDGAK